MATYNYEKLKSTWEQRGHTQKEIAELIGITEVALSRKVNGITQFEFTGTQLALICERIGSPMDMFVTKKPRFKRLGE